MEQINQTTGNLYWKLTNPVGIVVKRGTHTDCWIELLDAQPHSAHYATTYEGWSLVPDTKIKTHAIQARTAASFGIYKGCLKVLEG